LSVRGRILDLGMGALAAAQLGAAAWLVPSNNAVATPDGVQVPGMCWFSSLFGLDCPFCGMTRSFVALAHGDFGSALRFHPAGPLLFAAMVVFLVAVVAVAIRRTQPLVERRRFVLAFESVAVICVAIGLFRLGSRW
jgi:hypothetical protein